MPSLRDSNHTDAFWSKLIVETGVDLPDLPDNYRSDNGSFLLGMVAKQSQSFLGHGCDVSDDESDWITAKTVDGAMFAYPKTDSTLCSSNPMSGGSAKNIDPKAFGLIVSMIVFSHASFVFSEKHPILSQIMSNGYHSLRSSFYSLLDVALYPSEISDTGDETQQARIEWFAGLTDEQKTALDDMSTAIYSMTN